LLVKEREHSQAQVNSPRSPPQLLDIPDANIILQSSDHVNFPVHKSLLAMMSPVFKNLLSVSQSSESESIDGLPVVRLSENADVLNSLISILYPVRLVKPNSYEKLLNVLAACRKYGMNPSVYAKFSNSITFRSEIGPFGSYAIASSIGVISEIEFAGRRTLQYPMTLETLGDKLRLFTGSAAALRNLTRFRRRCRDNLITCLESYLDVHAPGPSKIWVGCPHVMPRRPPQKSTSPAVLPTWLCQVLSQTRSDLKLKGFTHSLTDLSSGMSKKCLTAIQTHAHCNFCMRVHATKGSTFYGGLEHALWQASYKVRTFL
jgi:hypothetical protein